MAVIMPIVFISRRGTFLPLPYAFHSSHIYSIRVARRKDRDTLGTDHVITPLRRSVRHLNAHTHEERLARGLDFEVAGVHEVFDATGCYAFTPNKSLRGYDKAAATGSGDGGEGLAMTVDASKSAGKWRK